MFPAAWGFYDLFGRNSIYKDDGRAKKADNGDWNPATRAYTIPLTVLPNRTISVQLSVPQYGNFFHTIISPASGNTGADVFTATEVVKLPTVSGTITLPAPSVNGTWVSVQGYNTRADIERLITAVAKLLPSVTT